jgi:biopolymer transport protein ExbD
VASSSLYEDDETAAITDINVTPFVDVVLVLLIIFMVTARLIVGRGIDIDKPKAATGGEVHSTLRVSVDQQGGLHVNGTPFADDASAIARIKEVSRGMDKPKAIVAGDQRTAYGGVMRAIDLVKQAGIDAIALENVAPPAPTPP